MTNISENEFDKKNKWLLCMIIVIVTLIPYFQVVNFEFITYDDNEYVYDNPYISEGITQKGLIHAFKPPDQNSLSYWHPVTWISHMVDCQLFGLNPGMHHLINLIFHLLNGVLLFLLFHQLTGKIWESFFIALVFSIHPINVESVAWISERKNVLCTFFGFLSLTFYFRFIKTATFHQYGLSLLCFMLGLMAKPKIITLPFVMMLLDYWPIGRIWNRSRGVKYGFYSVARSGIEKLPFFMVSVVFVKISTAAAQKMGIMLSLETAPLALRIKNALVSYVAYIGKFIWPVDLAFLYPYPDSIPFWKVLGASLILFSITLLSIYFIKKKPYVFVGWCWFLGTMSPMIGLVQQGFWPKMADRFAYIPFIGLYMIIGWAFAEVLMKQKRKAAISVLASMTVLLAVFTFAAWKQTARWKNSITLYEHTLSVTTRNYLVHNNLGNAYLRQGRYREAAEQYTQIIADLPWRAEVQFSLGVALLKIGRKNEAISHLKTSLRFKPESNPASNVLKMILNNRKR